MQVNPSTKLPPSPRLWRAGRVKIHADSRYPVDRKLVREAVARILADYQVGGKVEIEITICGNRKIRQLNKQFRGVDETTDVLSFPLHKNISQDTRQPDGVLRLGDVVVSWPWARTVAVKSNCLISAVVADLVGHGMRHLLGVHHG